MDVVLQVGVVLQFIGGIIGFNPCFDGCGSSRNGGRRKAWPSPSVSILVLMDVVLQEKTGLAKNLIFVCFNPCFDGCGSSSPPVKGNAGWREKFQSLF